MKRERNYSLFEDEYWVFRRFDGRRREFRGWSKAEFYAAQIRHYERHWGNMPGPQFIYEYRRREIAFFATVPYEFQGDGTDDFNKYQRPANNGVGYVAICHGESTHYVDDQILVAYLTKKYNKHFINK